MARVVLAMGKADFLLKYRGSVLGYVWSFVAPACKFVVILYVFRQIVGVEDKLYPLSLLLGIILWEHFALTTLGCIGMLWDKESIIQKVRIPRLLLPLAVGYQNLLVLGTYTIIFLIALPLLGGRFTLTGTLYLPLLAAQTTFIGLGVGMLLSSFALKFRDIRHLWEVVLQVLFWLTPVTYPFGMLRSSPIESLQRSEAWLALDAFVHLQPLSVIMTAARSVILKQGMVVSPLAIVLVTAGSALIFLLGAIVFKRRSRYFIQEY